jgi:serine/threonine-protein phosphatase 2A activator
LAEFHKTGSFTDLIAFVSRLQVAVWSKSIDVTPKRPEFAIFDDYFLKIREALDATPPVEGKNRFGNLAFRDFYDKVQDINEAFVTRILVELGAPAEYIYDLRVYLDEAYGDRSRVDYGTGHELNFLIFLFCINKIKPFKEEALEALVHQVFYDYIFTMRKIQLQYNLEPAGSHGVWGLDDYHFLPFIFGGAELADNQVTSGPKAIRDPLVVEQLQEKYMYMNCIAFIRRVKKGVEFGHSSPTLNDIAEAANWNKVALGMVKMYQVEVFGKLPVVQHIRFGRFFEFK